MLPTAMLDWQPISTAPHKLGSLNTVWLGLEVYVTISHWGLFELDSDTANRVRKLVKRGGGFNLVNDDLMWGGYWNGEEWIDRDDTEWHPKRYGQPTRWAPMLPENAQKLPEEKDDAGGQLLKAIDDDKLPVQGSMWVHGPLGWKHFLVTPDIAKVVQGVRDIFTAGRVSQAMVLDDVAIVGPNDHTFQILAKLAHVNSGGRAVFEGPETLLFGFRCDNGDTFDIRTRINAVVYRALKTVDGADFVRPRRPDSPKKELIVKAVSV